MRGAGFVCSGSLTNIVELGRGLLAHACACSRFEAIFDVSPQLCGVDLRCLTTRNTHVVFFLIYNSVSRSF